MLEFTFIAIFGLLSVSLIMFCIALTMGLSLLSRYLKRKETMNESISNYRAMVENISYKKQLIEYSKDLLSFIRTFVMELCVYRWNEFTDNRDITKMTRKNIENLIREISNEARKSLSVLIDDDLISTSSIYNQEYVDQYIVDMVIVTIKRLSTKLSDEYEESGGFENE